MDIYIQRQIKNNAVDLYCGIVSSAIDDYKAFVSSKKVPSKNVYKDGKSAYAFLNTDKPILGKVSGKEILSKIHEDKSLKNYFEVEKAYEEKERKKEEKRMLEAKAKAFSIEARAMKDYASFLKKAEKNPKLAVQFATVNEMYKFFLNTENYVSYYDFMKNITSIKGNMYEALLKNKTTSKSLSLGLRKAAAKAAGDKTSVSKRYASLPALEV